MWMFKRKRGNTESRKWYCEFKDHLDTVRRVVLSTDKRASEEMARNLERLVAYRQAKRPLDGALLGFVDGLASELRAALSEWGIIDRQQTVAGIPLMVLKKVRSRNGAPAFEITGGHLAEYRASLQSRENSPHRILQVINRCRDIVKGGGFKLQVPPWVEKVVRWSITEDYDQAISPTLAQGERNGALLSPPHQG